MGREVEYIGYDVIDDYFDEMKCFQVTGEAKALETVLEQLQEEAKEYEDTHLVVVSCNQGQTSEMTVRERYWAIMKVVITQLQKEFPEKGQLWSRLLSKNAEEMHGKSDLYPIFKNELSDYNFYLVLKDFEFFLELFPDEQKTQGINISYPFVELSYLSGNKSGDAPRNLATLLLSKKEQIKVERDLFRENNQDSPFNSIYTECHVQLEE